MPSIKNQLTTVFLTSENKKLIPSWIEYTTNYYRPYDPGQFLYKQLIDYPKETGFSDHFIELIYATLISWNMNQRGAKLSDFEIFKNSLLKKN